MVNVKVIRVVNVGLGLECGQYSGQCDYLP